MDLVEQHNARIIVTAAGAEGMPADAAERVDNVKQLMDLVEARGIPLDDVYIDGLVFRSRWRPITAGTTWMR